MSNFCKIFAGILLFPVLLNAGELIRLGDMDKAQAKDLHAECATNGGKLSFFTEEYTWNRCGKLEVDKIHRQQKYELVNAALIIGRNGKNAGAICKPDTTYTFSVMVKGNAAHVEVKGVGWDKATGFYGFKKLGQGITYKLNREWNLVKGEFTTGKNTKRIALCLQMWSSSKLNPLKFKVGDYVLFDSPSLKEKKKVVFSGAKVEAEPLKIVKIASAAGEKIDDFTQYRTGSRIQAATTAVVNADKKGLKLVIRCQEPAKITLSGKNLWSGDVVEIFFGPKKNDRNLSQFVISPDNRVFTGRGTQGQVNTPWQHSVKKGKNFWEVTAYIPFETLGWENPADGDSIAFNICRQRIAAKEMQSWAPVKMSFGDVQNFGRLRLGKYPAGMTRAAFEKADAQKKADERKALLERFSKYTFLAAPVNLTDDNKLPYMPEALFKPVEKITVNAAVNEIRPLVIAVANMTNKTQTYRITLEQPIKGQWQAVLPKTFPGSSIRECVAVKDNRDASGALYDILPRINEASTVTIPAKTARPVFIDIDTADMTPGVKKGNLRIIPLTGKGGLYDGYWRAKYRGEMRVIPFELNVRNIILSKEPARPGAFSSYVSCKNSYDLARAAGQRIFKFDIWSFNWKLKNGDFTGPCRAESLLDHAKSLGMTRLMIAYSAWDTYHSIYGKKSTPYYEKWLKKMAELVKAKGFDLKNCEIEVFDEPNPKRMTEVIDAVKKTRKTLPEIQVLLVLGAHPFEVKYLNQLFPYVDILDFWRHGYFRKPEYLAFIAKMKKAGKKLRHYTCATDPRASLHGNYRMMAWFGEYHQADSDSCYRLEDERRGCAWLAPTSGELLIQTDTSSIPTMRYMALRQGVMDVKYLAKLKEAGKNSPEAQAFLKNAAKRVVDDFNYDASMPDKVREEAAHLILKLQKEGKK